MRVTYVALRDIQVGDDIRARGDLVPEAQDWNYLSGYITDGKLFPVLVATLPEEQQEMLLDWEEDVYGPLAVSETVNGPESEQPPAPASGPEQTDKASVKVAVKPKKVSE
jgi:hypothetical protein